jgi:hypothetical protein
VFSIGVDLGQAADYSTVAVVRSVGDDLHLVHLHRFPLGTDYTVVVDGIVDFYEDDRLGEGGQPPLLTLDETGVGRAISDLLLSTHAVLRGDDHGWGHGPSVRVEGRTRLLEGT